jgi:hypothetical protein
MKTMNVFFCAAVCLFMVSCSDEKTTQTESVETVQPAPAASSTTTRNTTIVTPPAVVVKEKVEVTVKEPAKTEISIGQSGGSVKTKKGTDVSVGETGVKVGTKDVNIDIKRDRK